MKPWFYNYRIILYFLSLAIIFTGCSSHDKMVDKFDKWETLAESSQPVTPVHKKDNTDSESTPEDKSLTKNTTFSPETQRQNLYENKYNCLKYLSPCECILFLSMLY